ncbi:MAG: adenylosuccinate lyase [Armatimonadetes bacterium]|nr:adenylosuccinate lyase [Armatimonadota bacterium]
MNVPDPLVARYLPSAGLPVEAVRGLSELGLYTDYCVRLEVALLRVLARRGFFGEALVDEICRNLQISEQELREEETRVRHDLKALVNVFSRFCPEPVRPFVHLGATSYDILSNAHLLRLREGVERLARPALLEVARELCRLADQEAETVQIGRTHGQYAEPITFGYAMAVYLERLGQCLEALDHALGKLRGKFSGAVGAWVAAGLLFDDPRQLEREVLAEVGLEPSLTSTQIAHPEPALAVLHHLCAGFGVLANLADDLRHLQRSEIAEVAEAYRADSQVGSSAMPHKRNPITWENVKSLWKTFMPQILTYYMDQISEHQRDLSNSASARFLPRLVLGVTVAAKRAAGGLRGLYVDREAMRRRLESLDQVISGPAQVLLSSLGFADAHEAVRRHAVSGEGPLLERLQADEELSPYLARLSDRQLRALQEPARMVEPCVEATRKAVLAWSERLEL